MEINIKLNVAEIGTIISEVACSISASKNMDKNGMRMSDAAISILEDIFKSDVDDEDMPFPENETSEDKTNKENAEFNATTENVTEYIGNVMGVNEND